MSRKTLLGGWVNKCRVEAQQHEDTVSTGGILDLSTVGIFRFLGFGGINRFTSGFHPFASLSLRKWYSLFWRDHNQIPTHGRKVVGETTLPHSLLRGLFVQCDMNLHRRMQHKLINGLVSSCNFEVGSR